MKANAAIRIVPDTNVIFEGLTKQGGACGFIIDAWRAGLFQVCLSDAVAHEYVDVLTRKLSATRWEQIKPVLRMLLAQSTWVAIYYSWRPASPDPGDDLVTDCAMNAGAIVVTSNMRDFHSARESLGLTVMTPVNFVKLLAE
ncbi:MAG: PIN domain-containing protein [Anaerolineales bacterium]|nr:PIN domain-containing protein [Anaerolineales bacterium]